MRNSALIYPYDPADDLYTAMLSDMENGKVTSHCIDIQQVLDKIPGDSLQAKLDSCAACKCCVRHQTFRPKRLVPWTDDMSKGSKPHYRGKRCECDCRHLARWICREVGNNSPTGPILEEIIEDQL